MIRDLVELGGYEAIVTRNGDEAKAMLRRRQLPELVVANLSLPRLDGFALLADLRRISGPTGPPVVVVSSSKELSGAAWNLKERLGVTELLAADATESQALETLALALPALRHPGSALDKPVASRRRARALGQRDDRSLPRGCRAALQRRRSCWPRSPSASQEWFRVHVNQPRRAMAPGRSPRDWSFIRQVLEGNEPIVVPDVQQHPVFAQTEFPPAGTLRGYAGVPLFATSGRVAGAMCLFDLEPLSLDARALDALTEIGRRLALELDGSLERADSQERFTALSRLALTDQVTGLANRRGGEEALAREVARARRSGSPLSLVLFDIDRFKRINDEAGHAVGDRVLRGISEILSASQRGSDLAMRWGGEEFLVLLPDVGLTGARIFAERVRENVQNLVIQDAGRITVSAGVSELERRRRSRRRARARGRQPLSRESRGPQSRRSRPHPSHALTSGVERQSRASVSARCSIVVRHYCCVSDVQRNRGDHRRRTVAPPEQLRRRNRRRRRRQLRRGEPCGRARDAHHQRIRFADAALDRGVRRVRVGDLQTREHAVERNQNPRPRRGRLRIGRHFDRRARQHHGRAPAGLQPRAASIPAACPNLPQPHHDRQ